ncbi:Gfo/Idh/MocA family oxidoreductase [Algoriphagus sp. H41]|uniref:Gfo/Idh/MocA family oxidoreductase n=1 Tax=Algoriphagus oliviformis TaxID=2811231 RepID=A0ABS3BZK1_9BACT|nr:Gfo/Idh/MocA family oxidoreductase [Algoriphagus oliviformis]MBN7810278.1 Gfo/Idh/MocA family oxidoreductase [Algoriphagus oliviformis]
MPRSEKLNRREFISSAATIAASISIVPSHVIAGTGHVPPSDQLAVANIGCGTQGLREMGEMLKNPKVRVVAVCDVNKSSTDYIDWSPNGIRDDIRETLGDPSWWEGKPGIPGGREIGQAYVEQYYAKNKPSGKYRGCASYEDFRELFAKEKGIDAVKIMTPDHTHASIALAAMDKKMHVVTHKPISNRLLEGRKVIEKAQSSGAITHLLAWSDRPEYRQIKAWMDAGLIGELKEIHNWSYRPVWQQWTKRPEPPMPVPNDFNWELWLGPVPDMPYHKNYTHNVFRGWYEFGGGSVADMGHYSLFPLFETLGISKSPTSARAFGTTTREEVNQVYQWVKNDVAFPASCTIKWKFPAQEKLPAFDLFWYDGGMKPFAPEELEMDGKDTPEEGLMIVGAKGKILGGFRGENPVLLPESTAMTGRDTERINSREVERMTDSWVEAMLAGEQTPGSFIRAQCITDTINLGAIALRSGKKVDFDANLLKITNDESANQLLTRTYRKGWEV